MVRAFAINRANHMCERCYSRGPLQIHHLHYDNLYNELPQDLEVLCKNVTTRLMWKERKLLDTTMRSIRI